MKVPYQLRRIPGEAASALLVPSHDAREVVDCCARLRLEPPPRIRAVAEGFLVTLSRPLTEAAHLTVGCVRLRNLADNLYLPADAELVPALLPEEAKELTSRRGWYFLPGPRILEVALAGEIPLSALVGAHRFERGAWQSLPDDSGQWAQNITEIALDLPEISPDDMLQEGGEGIGTEAGGPEEGGAAGKAVGGALMGLGKGLGWLGNALGMKGIAGMGAGLMGKALSLSPKLSESLMGQQEAILRALLKDFRDGNIDKALRRALPLDGNARGAGAGGPYQGTRLPTHNIFYGIMRLLGTSSGGAGGAWFTQQDTFFELQREYRKQAEAAIRRGDHRRAAFIYGVLLKDFRGAAAVLARAGLHRDAALIYLRKLQDHAAAAREYEAAGEIDRAVALYEKMGALALAGDVLRRAGEEERALEFFGRAAAELAGKEMFFAAGELLRARAGRRDLALAYFQDGWRRRPSDNPLGCAQRLADQHATAADCEAYLRLLAEVADFLPTISDEPASTLLNDMAKLGKSPSLAPIADDVGDRVLLALAKRLRDNAQAAKIPLLFPPAAAWPAPLVNDAQHAVAGKTLIKTNKEVPVHIPLRGGASVVSAVVQVPVTGELFVGFEHGEIVRFTPSTGEVFSIYRDYTAIRALACSEDGEHLVAIAQCEPHSACIASFSRSQGFRMSHYQMLATEGSAWLCPQLSSKAASKGHTAHNQALAWTGRHWQTHRLPDLVCVASSASVTEDQRPYALLYFLAPAERSPYLLIFVNRTVWIDPWWGEYQERPPSVHVELGWTAAPAGEEAPFVAPCLSQRVEGTTLHIAGISGGAPAHAMYSTMHIRDNAQRHTQNFGPALAAAVLPGGMVAAVTATGVRWCKMGKSETMTKVPLSNAVACFYHERARELHVISRDAGLTRIAVPKL